MSADRMTVRPLHIKVLRPDGSITYDSRLTWDAERLYDSLFEQYDKEHCMVQAVSQEEYDRHRFSKARR